MQEETIQNGRYRVRACVRACVCLVTYFSCEPTKEISIKFRLEGEESAPKFLEINESKLILHYAEKWFILQRLVPGMECRCHCNQRRLPQIFLRVVCAMESLSMNP